MPERLSQKIKGSKHTTSNIFEFMKSQFINKYVHQDVLLWKWQIPMCEIYSKTLDINHNK